MSPRRPALEPSEAVRTALGRLWATFGVELREARRERHWSIRELARRAGVSAASTYLVEAGRSASSETAIRLAHALGLRLTFELTDPRRRHPAGPRGDDEVHSAMGEVEARQLRALGFPVGIDEPYQHYQFAGRADVIAWDLDRAALLHIENRTRFPNIQDAAGAYNAKRAYLGPALAQRLGIGRWRSETHVMAGAWTSEILHVVRLRTESFRALCPDPPDACDAWWRGEPPSSGSRSIFIVLDPVAEGRERQYVGLEAALRVRPRHLGYASLATAILGGLTGSSR